MAITPEQIVETAEALAERGESPTLAAVRRELGGGSYTTISEALKGWRERRQATQARAEAVQVPTRVQEALAQAGVLVWTEATRQHAAQLAAEREALDLERQRFEAERREAVELADQVSRELERTGGEREQALQAFAQARQECDQARAEAREQRALAEERGRRGEVLDGELKELCRQSGETAEELGQVRGQLEALRGQLEELRAARAGSEAERERAQAELQEAQGEAREHRRRIQEQEAALEALRGQAGEAAAEGVRLSWALAQARQEAEALEAARVAQAAAERAAAALRLEVATLAERAVHVADLRAIVAALQAPASETAGGTTPELALEPAPGPKKKAAARRKGTGPARGGVTGPSDPHVL